jgi:hypothetical protein
MTPKELGAILAIVDRTFSEDEESILLAQPTATSRHRVWDSNEQPGMNDSEGEAVRPFEFFRNKKPFDKYLNSNRYYKTSKVSIWKHQVHIQIPEVVLALVLDEDGTDVANEINAAFGEENELGVEVNRLLRSSSLQSGDVFLSVAIRQVFQILC